LDATGTPSGSPPDRWWALYVSGELDLATGPGLDARMGRAVAQRHGDGLVLDLSTVTFVDCAGLRPVLRVRNRLGRRLCLRAVPAQMLRLLLLAELAGSLRMLPGEQPWPAEADPGRCGIILDDLFDHRPARPVVRLTRPDVSVLPSAAAT
jgi:anti-sigma B factor antagonist